MEAPRGDRRGAPHKARAAGHWPHGLSPELLPDHHHHVVLALLLWLRRSLRGGHLDLPVLSLNLLSAPLFKWDLLHVFQEPLSLTSLLPFLLSQLHPDLPVILEGLDRCTRATFLLARRGGPW